MSPRVRVILNEVSKRTGVSVADIMAHDRRYDFVLARFEAMAHVRGLVNPNGEPSFSYPAIGRIFDRDHATVINAVRRWVGMGNVMPVRSNMTPHELEFVRAGHCRAIAKLQAQIDEHQAAIADIDATLSMGREAA